MDVVPVRCYITGSSHITRLDKYIDKIERDGFRLNNYVVRLQGINRGFVNSIYRYLLDIQSFQPDIVFLQIGSNDIGDGNNSVSNVLVTIDLLIELLLSFKVKIVLFGLVPYRTRILPRRGLTLHQYNERVYSLNYRFYNIVCKFSYSVVHWIHRGIQFPNVNMLRWGDYKVICGHFLGTPPSHFLYIHVYMFNLVKIKKLGHNRWPEICHRYLLVIIGNANRACSMILVNVSK